jgi:hypothetical protein
VVFTLPPSSHAIWLQPATCCFERGIELYSGKVTLTSMASDFKGKVMFELDCAALLAGGHLNKHQRADVAVCKIANFVSATDRSTQLAPGVTWVQQQLPGTTVVGLPITGTRKFDDVYISNDIFLFGYPTALGREAQLDESKPLLRKGIVAGKTEDGRFVIDCPVYFGNSGGLVIEIVQTDSGIWYPGIGIAVEMVRRESFPISLAR